MTYRIRKDVYRVCIFYKEDLKSLVPTGSRTTRPEIPRDIRD